MVCWLVAYEFVLSAGLYPAASGLLCRLSFNVARSDSHVVLLKCLADAKEIPVAIEHIKWIRQASPSMLQTISNELASVSSSPTPEPISQLLQTI